VFIYRRVHGKVDRRIVLVQLLRVRVEEAAQARDHGREMNDDDLHLDVRNHIEVEDLLARTERGGARRDEHVALEPEVLDRGDHLVELCAPREDAQLSVLLEAAEYDVGRCFERIVEHVVLLDDDLLWDIGF